MYLYAARPARIIDGDTLEMSVDVGFNIHITQRIRLLGVNCAEHGTDGGDAATVYTTEWLAKHGPDLLLRTVKDRNDKYGRLLGIVMAGTRILNDDLVTAGHAVPYDGGRRTLPAHQGEPRDGQPVR